MEDNILKKQILVQQDALIAVQNELTRIQSHPTEKEIWLRAWSTVANSESCHSYNVATQWADKCLEDFKERFDD